MTDQTTTTEQSVCGAVKDQASPIANLVDNFGRSIRYLRLSVTDRCDFRCVYCMEEDTTFVPREEVLSLEELKQVAEAFVGLGVTKIRLTGGEPLVRSGVSDLCGELSAISGLNELVMTTNGSKLTRLAQPLKANGLQRLNVSLDTLKPERFRELTRNGSLKKVLQGLERAKQTGFEKIKLNAVIMRGRNDDEVLDLVQYATEQGFDISFIEEMPLGAISEHSRQQAFVSSAELQSMLAERWTLQPSIGKQSDGPSRYFQIEGSASRVGFISPHSNNFCGDCNRVRVTAEGRLLLCLGNEHSLDLRAVLRRYPNDLARLQEAIIAAMQLKPEKHHFDLVDEQPDIIRFMNATGG